MSQWFDINTGKTFTLEDMFEKLSDQELRGAEYALQLLHAQARVSRTSVRDHRKACFGVMKKRPGLRAAEPREKAGGER